MITLAWLLEIALESLGAYIYFRRNRLLCAMLSFCALTDFAALPLESSFPVLIHFWLGWGQWIGKELLMLILGCSICGMFVPERNRSQARISVAFVCLAAMAMVIAFSSSGKDLKGRFLEGEIIANLILLSVVALAWIGRHKVLDSRWKWITAGFILMVGSDLLFTGLWTFWDGARHFYPLGAIAAQLVWVIGPLRSVRLPEFRQSLEKKFPAVEEMRVM